MKKRNIISSFSFAWQGIAYAFRTQRNMRVHVAVAALVVIGASVLYVPRVECFLLCLFIVLVMFAELINTAMEVMVDMVSPEWREEAKLIKNVAAGGVLLCSISAFLVGLWVFIPRIIEWF